MILKLVFKFQVDCTSVHGAEALESKRWESWIIKRKKTWKNRASAFINTDMVKQIETFLCCILSSKHHLKVLKVVEQ